MLCRVQSRPITMTVSTCTGIQFYSHTYAHRRKKCVVNVQNCNDELCFLYSILAHIHRVEPERNPSHVRHYRPHLSELDTTGLTFPLPVKDVAKFERLNKDIAVNVMTFDERQPIPSMSRPTDGENTSSTCCY